MNFIVHLNSNFFANSMVYKVKVLNELHNIIVDFDIINKQV